MLGRLMKYETKATARTFILLYAVVIFLAVVNRIFYAFDFGRMFREYDGDFFFGSVKWLMNMLTGIFTFLYIAMIIAMFVAMTIVVIQRFYKNLFSDEGYLMFSLPVKSWEHIVSKMLVASMWMLVSIFVMCISILILLSHPAIIVEFREFWAEFMEALREVPFSLTPFVIEIIIICIISVIGFALPIYACISIGQLWKKHRVAGAFFAYFVLNIITQVITSVIFFLYVYGGYHYFESLDHRLLNENAAQSMILGYTHGAIWIFILLSVLLSVIYFIVSNHIIKNKLDLE